MTEHEILDLDVLDGGARRAVKIDQRFDLRLGITGLDGRLRLDGNELSAEVSARLYDRRSELEFGEVEGRLQLTLDDSQKMQGARWQGSLRQVMLAAFQGKVPPSPFLPLTGLLDSDLWGEWSREQGHRVNGMTVLEDALLSNEYQDIHLEQLDYRFQWRFKALRDWNLHLADFHFDDGSNASVAGLRDGLDQARFEGEYGGVDDRRYLAVVDDIDARIGALPAFR